MGPQQQREWHWTRGMLLPMGRPHRLLACPFPLLHQQLPGRKGKGAMLHLYQQLAGGLRALADLKRVQAQLQRVQAQLQRVQA